MNSPIETASVSLVRGIVVGIVGKKTGYIVLADGESHKLNPGSEFVLRLDGAEVSGKAVDQNTVQINEAKIVEGVEFRVNDGGQEAIRTPHPDDLPLQICVNELLDQAVVLEAHNKIIAIAFINSVRNGEQLWKFTS